jgi:hypothetical protein
MKALEQKDLLRTSPLLTHQMAPQAQPDGNASLVQSRGPPSTPDEVALEQEQYLPTLDGNTTRVQAPGLPSRPDERALVQNPHLPRSRPHTELLPLVPLFKDDVGSGEHAVALAQASGGGAPDTAGGWGHALALQQVLESAALALQVATVERPGETTPEGR